MYQLLTYIFRSMKSNSSPYSVRMCSCISKRPVPLPTGCWPYSSTIGICFRFHVIIDVYDARSYILCLSNKCRIYINNLCNKKQLDALFILSLFRQSTSTCFGHICGPSSGGILYIYNNWYVLYIYSIPPDDRLQICPKHVEVDWLNKLRINSASSWFLLHRGIEMHGQLNIKYFNNIRFLKHYYMFRCL